MPELGEKPRVGAAFPKYWPVKVTGVVDPANQSLGSIPVITGVESPMMSLQKRSGLPADLARIAREGWSYQAMVLDRMIVCGFL